ncbi:glycerol-3-phosphate 1-O-acyltransferase PlsY [Tepidimonas charontis]|uniref:Glycerol-3-phosphate acyltransferase n=1 Tax=Tepidimonas charontis TaxID=2267262 RepID=A0A554XF40_9BURK|nr:glycerol-3-phosphate 1-O-acyltransferase PlsY [Tepidimonas charontis]TSE34446.1 putative glycerol-3-phosphate acyltransferase [Tepidimonas charontis]
MHEVWMPWAAVVLAYAVGSLSFAVLVSRLMGLRDPRTYGSKNPGATNVLRSGNKAAAALTLLLDAVKGWLPVWAVAQWGGAWGWGPMTVAAVGLAAFLGHLFPVFFRFQGGKGVATAAGVLLAFEPWLGVAVIASWILVAVFFRYSSLAAIVAAVFAPLYYWFGDGAAWDVQAPVGAAVAAMSVLLLWRHAGNIQRLIAGQESRIGEKKAGRR